MKIAKIALMSLLCSIYSQEMGVISLADQLESLYKQEIAINPWSPIRCASDTIVYLKDSKVGTVRDFEKSIHISSSGGYGAVARVFDYVIYHRCVKDFLILLVHYRDQLKNYKEIVFNTDSVEWESVLSFEIENDENWDKHIEKIINAIYTVQNKELGEVVSLGIEGFDFDTDDEK